MIENCTCNNTCFVMKFELVLCIIVILCEFVFEMFDFMFFTKKVILKLVSRIGDGLC